MRLRSSKRFTYQVAAAGYRERPGVYRRLLSCAANLLKATRVLPSGNVAGGLLALFPPKELDAMKTRIYAELSRHDPKKLESLERMYPVTERCALHVLCSLSEDYLPNQFLLEEVTQFLDKELQRSAVAPAPCPIEERVRKVAEIFKLDDASQDVLWLKYLAAVNEDYQKIKTVACEVTGSSDSNYWSKGYMGPVYALLTGRPLAEFNRALGREGRLQQSGLMDTEQGMAVEILEYLSGHSETALLSHYYHEIHHATLELDQFSVETKQIDMLKKLLNHRSPTSGSNILFYGRPGTGKTELARALGKSQGLTVYEIQNPSDNLKLDFRLRALKACESQIDSQKSLIIIDEADQLLNSGSFLFRNEHTMEKGRLNMLLEESQCCRIWITNESEYMDESSLRRFDYSLHFPKLTFQQRKTIWSHCAEKHGVRQYFQEDELEQLAEVYESNAGAIDSTLRACKRMYEEQASVEGIRDTVDTLMKSHLQRMEHSPLRSNAKTANAPQYGVEGLTIKGDLSRTMEILQGFNRHWEKAQPDTFIKNMNLLLYGPPGTGKTEFAKHIARELKRRLIVKSGSDLLSKWVGGTEKNIRSMFEEAQKEKAVLFVDEADGLFASREGASQSWQVTQANELLTSMEQFEGILICSTNFKRNIDEAAIRRFNLKLEFDLLQPEGNVIFYQRFLSKLLSQPLPKEEEEHLMALSHLAPGDFKVVYQQHVFLPRETLTHEMLITALADEIRHKGKSSVPIGFGKT